MTTGTTRDAMGVIGAGDPTQNETCTLQIGGMTCASCVRRIEKALNKLEGVAVAQVNLATEVASITYAPNLIGVSELTAAVTKAGYTAIPATTGQGQARTAVAETTAEGDRDRELRQLKRRWQVALFTGLGLM